jgi:hypothetical protein
MKTKITTFLGILCLLATGLLIGVSYGPSWPTCQVTEKMIDSNFITKCVMNQDIAIVDGDRFIHNIQKGWMIFF